MKSLLKKRRFKLPNTLILLFIAICFFGILSLILSWQNVTTTNEKDEKINIYGAGILQWISTIPVGLYNSVGISVFLFIFGSFMFVTIKTKAMNSIVLNFLKKIKFNLEIERNFETNFIKKIWIEFKNMFKTTWVVIPIMLFLSLNGTFNGMGTSSLPLYAFVVPIFLAAGFDIWSAFLVVFIGAGSGVIGSTVNPFATIIANDISNQSIESYSNLKENISISDGMAWRWVVWIVMFISACLCVMIYSYRVKKNKQNSYFKDKFEYYKSEFDVESMEKVSGNIKRNLIITLVFIFSFVLMLFLVIPYDKITQNNTFSNVENVTFNNNSSTSWFNNSGVNSRMQNGSNFQFGSWNLTALSVWFLFCTVIIAKIARFSWDLVIEHFTIGCKKMIPAVLCIGFASGISVLFEATNLKYLFINGIIDNVKKSSGDKRFTVPILTYILTIPVSLLIPSTSGLAKAIFPLLGPSIYEIEKAEGITQNHCLAGSITAYTMGIGLGNLFAPTYAAVMVSTQFCKISYVKFLKSIYKLLIIFFIICLLLIVFGALINVSTPDTKLSIF